MSTTVTVRVPIKLRRQGCRKAIVTPEGALAMPARVDVTLVKALARAFRWRKLLETGVFGTIDELARAEKINPSYVSRVLRLTLLAPDVVEAALDSHPTAPDVRALMMVFPAEWDLQRHVFLPGRVGVGTGERGFHAALRRQRDLYRASRSRPQHRKTTPHLGPTRDGQPPV